MRKDEPDGCIRELCDRRGWNFKPGRADEGPSPHPPATGGRMSWPKAQRLRRRVLAEWQTEDAPMAITLDG